MTFSDLDWLDGMANPIPRQIVGVTVSVMGVGNFDETNVMFTAESVTWDFAGVTGTRGDFILVELDVEHGVVPEPATIALFGLGLAGLAARTRRRP